MYMPIFMPVCVCMGVCVSVRKSGFFVFAFNETLVSCRRLWQSLLSVSCAILSATIVSVRETEIGCHIFHCLPECPGLRTLHVYMSLTVCAPDVKMRKAPLILKHFNPVLFVWRLISGQKESCS